MKIYMYKCSCPHLDSRHLGCSSAGKMPRTTFIYNIHTHCPYGCLPNEVAATLYLLMGVALFLVGVISTNNFGEQPKVTHNVCPFAHEARIFLVPTSRHWRTLKPLFAFEGVRPYKCRIRGKCRFRK